MTIPFFTYLVSTVVLIISLLWMVKLLGNNFILTLPGFFYVHFIVFIFLGSPVFFLLKGADNFQYIIATHLVMLIFPLGIVIMNKLMKIKFQLVFNSYMQEPVNDEQSGNQFIFLYLFVLGVAITVTLLYYSKLEIIPINFMINNLLGDINITDLAKLRESSTTTFKLGKLHRYKFFMAQLIPFLVVLAMLKSKLTKKNVWRILFVVLAVFAMYRSISDLQKKPLLDFIILLFTASWIFRGKINWKQVGILVGVSIGILSLMYIFIMGLTDRPFLTLLEGISSRLFLGQTAPLYYYFSLFPSSHDFVHGASLPNPAGIFQFEHFPITKWIFVNGLNRSWEIVGTAPSAFIGEMYANFGYPIMVLSILVLSLILQYIQIKFITRPRTLLLTAFYAYFVFLSGQFAMTGLFVVAHLYLILFLFTAIVFVDGYSLLVGALYNEK
ncbi:MAG TPA: hypothetical protein EYO19_01655 [Candidatus Marinimicrobia bacterium]|nr:hypothetical protein [Candidatus Neomarinimicrobiota bacterium]